MSPSRHDNLEAALARVFEDQNTRASWFALTGGELLFSAGDEPDSLYLVRSGRLGVFRQDEDQPPQFLGVIKPGEPVGEMALIAGTPHSASVVALRDSEILALPRDVFFEAVRTQPDVMIELSRLMLHRARERAPGVTEPSVFGFISVRGRPIRPFVDRLAAAVEAQGHTCQVIDHSALSSVSEWFSRMEDSHDFVLYVAELDEPSWANLCARQVDRLFLIGDALTAPPANIPIRTAHGLQQFTDLILLRDPRMRRPANTAVWLDAINPGRWFHAIEGDAADAARIARIITGRAVGLVLSGGGARAYAHIGAVRALHEAGVRFDFLGGSSMGAVIAAGPALGWTDEELDARIRTAFVRSDPLSDLAFPIIAMTRAGKVARLLQDAYGEIDIADMPLPFFAVSSNLTSGRIEVHRRGLLRRAMRASISIPGVMPPVVIDGQVLVDGAVIKNFPTDVMRQMNAGPIIGVDMSQTRGVDPATLANPPSWWRWIVSGAWKKGPPIVSVLMRSATITTDADMESSRADTDLLILPEPDGSDIRDWKVYDPVVAAGHAAAVKALAKLEGPIETLRQRADATASPLDQGDPEPAVA
ncbi:MAG: cyclic nucleotide-binding protein [Brevundimonas subvibrioides]|uniref:Cyclic nucleotide-binding protein n=1 Tax=Brevundimonas subvibrioides TaxID=74313 RepID=A0A258HDV6_9CAUL|nr:patatin-like phospholipase family protein [Brevundimonas subvibrioides]OYX54794.1 MAG: cyclic nucleotide-binding protein [Brevundimonas subvibrioides]